MEERGREIEKWKRGEEKLRGGRRGREKEK